jgi:acetate kinase
VTPPLLTVNAGSTSLKLAVVSQGEAVARPASLDELLDGPPTGFDAVVHRVVHGGERTEAAVLDDGVVAELRVLVDLAPLHQPAALDGIDRCRAAWPDLAQVACFDTTFHRTIPAAAATYALPARLRETVRVYGFHGLSHAWAAARAGEELPDAGRVVVAHLGGGQSLCAVADGRSVMTTMGFTPLDGLVMATRSGALDPGAVLWLAEHTDEDLGRVLEEESGLLGLAGTGDMREVLEREAAGDADARLALEVYLHRFLRELGGCVAVLGGLDALVFTGGVGQHAGALRDRRSAREPGNGGPGAGRRVPGGPADGPGSRRAPRVVILRTTAASASEPGHRPGRSGSHGARRSGMPDEDDDGVDDSAEELEEGAEELLIPDDDAPESPASDTDVQPPM